MGLDLFGAQRRKRLREELQATKLAAEAATNELQETKAISELMRGQLRNLNDSVSQVFAQNNNLQNQLANTFGGQGAFVKYNYQQTIGYIRDGYQLNSAVYSIVSDIAIKASQIPLKVYDVKNQAALKAYEGMQTKERSPENVYKAMKLKAQALVEVPEDDPLQYLLDNPSSVMQRDTFYQTVYGFRLLTGNTYLYVPSIPGGANEGKLTEFFIMPSQFTAIITTNIWPRTILGYELIVNGVTILVAKEVIQLKYPNYDWSIDGNELYGLSPLRAGARTLINSNYQEIRSNAMFENGGPQVIVSNESITPDSLSPEQMGKIKELWKNEYTGPQNANKVKLSVGKVNVQNLGLTAVEMDLIAAQGFTFRQIANLYHMSTVEFNDKDANTESNVKEMLRSNYTRAILPETKALCDALNKTVAPRYNTKGVRKFIDMDISGIPALQPDMVALTTWLAAAYWVTPNEKREMQDFGRSADPNMDSVWLPTNLIKMDDAAIPVHDGLGIGEPAAGGDV